MTRTITNTTEYSAKVKTFLEVNTSTGIEARKANDSLNSIFAPTSEAFQTLADSVEFCFTQLDQGKKNISTDMKNKTGISNALNYIMGTNGKYEEDRPMMAAIKKYVNNRDAIDEYIKKSNNTFTNIRSVLKSINNNGLKIDEETGKIIEKPKKESETETETNEETVNMSELTDDKYVQLLIIKMMQDKKDPTKILSIMYEKINKVQTPTPTPTIVKVTPPTTKKAKAS
jgi:hypothetical protein